MTKSDRSLGFALVATAFLFGYALGDAFPNNKWLLGVALVVSSAAYLAFFRYVNHFRWSW